MATTSADFVGIGVGKSWLDIALSGSGVVWQEPNPGFSQGPATTIDRR